MIETLSVHGADASVVLKDQSGRVFVCLLFGRGGWCWGSKYVGYNGKVPVICVMIDTLSEHGADASVVLKDQSGRIFVCFLLGGEGLGVGFGVLNVRGYSGKVPVICVMIDTLSVHRADASVVLKDQTGGFIYSVQWAEGRGGLLKFVCL